MVAEDDFDEQADPMATGPDLSHWAYFFTPIENRVRAERWRVNGKCFNKPELVEMFNPPLDGDGEQSPRAITIEAKKYCLGVNDGMRCSAIAQCLDYAIEHKIHTGVWGATSWRERRRIAARRNAQASKKRPRTSG